MPVTKRQFELGVTAECEQIMRSAYQFLSARSDYAYSLAEIAEGLVQELPPEQVALNLDKAIEVLVGLFAIDQRKLGHETDEVDYYAVLQEFDTGTWKSLRGIPPAMPVSSDR